MKNILIASCLVLISALLSGCATEGYRRADTTSTSLQLASARTDTCVQRVDAVVAALADLLDHPAPDLKLQFQTLGREITALEAQNRDIQSRMRSLQEKEAGYLKKWDEELALIQNQQLRERSAERKTTVMSQFTKVNADYDETQKVLNPFIAELNDIKRALSVDLTQAGVASLKETMATAQTDGGIVRKSLIKLADHFKELGTSLSTQTPSEATDKAK